LVHGVYDVVATRDPALTARAMSHSALRAKGRVHVISFAQLLADSLLPPEWYCLAPVPLRVANQLTIQLANPIYHLVPATLPLGDRARRNADVPCRAWAIQNETAQEAAT